MFHLLAPFQDAPVVLPVVLVLNPQVIVSRKERDGIVCIDVLVRPLRPDVSLTRHRYQGSITS